MHMGISSGIGGSGLNELSMKVMPKSSHGAAGWEAYETHQS